MGWLISNAKIKLEEIIKEQLKISLSFKESGYNNSMKDVVNKIIGKITNKLKVIEPLNSYKVSSSVERHCFMVAFDRFNNGGYCVNLQDHSRA